MKKTYLFFTALFASILFFTACKKEEYIVTFNPNGGKGVLITQNFTYNVAQPLMANSFTNKGNLFTGWNTATNGKGTAYKDQETVKIKGHTVLYAQWELATGIYTVTFDANGGIGEMAQQIFDAAEPQALYPNAFYYEGYQFTGWNSSPNGKGKDYINEQSITISTDLTLYAQWYPMENTYFVIFNANGGEGTMESQAFKEYVYQKLDSNSFTREGYLYKGWNTKADGSGYSYQDGVMIQINANMMLYAQWVNPDGGGKPCPGIPTLTDIDGNTIR